MATSTWCVYYATPVGTPKYFPRIIVTNVPEGEKVTFDLLERAGYLIEEFGVPWANHGIMRITKEAPSDLVARIRQGMGKRISWSDLLERAEAPL